MATLKLPVITSSVLSKAQMPPVSAKKATIHGKYTSLSEISPSFLISTLYLIITTQRWNGVRNINHIIPTWHLGVLEFCGVDVPKIYPLWAAVRWIDKEC